MLNTNLYIFPVLKPTRLKLENYQVHEKKKL